MSVYLYTPPQWKNPVPMEKALILHSVMTSTLVYRQGGVWHNQLAAYMGQPDVASVDVIAIPGADPAFRLFFTRPTVVPGSLYNELSAITPADPSWTSGSLTLL